MNEETNTFDPQDIPKRFDFQTAQEQITAMWDQGQYFHASSEADDAREPFTIVIPPPNVTGALHLGHALNNTLQDTIIRMRRMQGFNTLWMPGTDHAGIATQAVVEKRLKEDENKTRHDLGREKLVERIWDWKDQYEKRILGQLKQMGCSCDFQRTRFTLDERCASAVRHTFFDLFKKQLIYRGKRLVNWDTHLRTAVSDDEVYSETVKGSFWHFMYPVIDPQPGEPAHVLVATTRPETMLGDTAVAVHPDPEKALAKVEADLREKLEQGNAAEKADAESQLEALEERRQHYLPTLKRLRDMAMDGRMLMLPLMNRPIPLIVDEWPKPELGSGCVKITPAHDPNDYDVAKRCDLEMINILNTDGTLNAEAGDYAGLTMKQARKKVVNDIEALGLLEKIEDRDIELPFSDRSKTPIEPFLADQWFVAMNELAQSAMDAVTDERVRIFPERYSKSYLDWLSEKRDWPVSRQLWWGHQIPVWSMPCEEEADVEPAVEKIQSLAAYRGELAAVQVEQSEEPDEEKRRSLGLPFATIHVCVEGGHAELEQQLTELGLVREEDVLDTWFSSALWPHSTLGWPESTDDLARFYPTSVLITSRDIITLWVARMVLMGLNNCGDIPFSQVFIHPKILDGDGQTMSKSRGNGVDPFDVINSLGADSLRFGMAELCTLKQDVRLPVRMVCPHCDHAFDQTVDNRTLPKLECPDCKKTFSTQWAREPEDVAIERGSVTSERFEVARNFVNKLWNASRFAMLNLEGYQSAPIQDSDLTVEDRWMLSRLATMTRETSASLDSYAFSEAASNLRDFAWNEFCSFYIEMLKDRFSDETSRAPAQRILAYSLDCLLRLLHPIMPFVTEEIWQNLAKLAPERGFESVQAPAPSISIAAWPKIDGSWQNDAIEQQFSLYQKALRALRDVRASQKIANKRKVNFLIRCSDEIADRLRPLSGFFGRMAASELVGLGPDVVEPEIVTVAAEAEFEILVDLEGLIDVPKEIERLTKEKGNLEKSIQGKQRQLDNERFVAAKPDLAEEIRVSLGQAQEQLKIVDASLSRFLAMKEG